MTPAEKCSYCGATLDASTSALGDHVPAEGDVGICLYCARPHIFEMGEGGGLRRRRPTEEEHAAIALNPDFSRVISTIKTHGPRKWPAGSLRDNDPHHDA